MDIHLYKRYFPILSLTVSAIISSAIVSTAWQSFAYVGALSVSAVLCWHYGNKWNLRHNQAMASLPQYKFLFIPTQYYGILYGILALLWSFQLSLILGSIIAILVFIEMLLHLKQQKFQAEKRRKMRANNHLLSFGKKALHQPLN
jgi:hypothetical protein